MILVDRVQQILCRPQETWPVIAAEAIAPMEFYKQYLIPLGAITPICLVLGWSMLGIVLPFSGGTGLAMMGSLVFGLWIYAATLASVAFYALIINVLAPSFGGAKDYSQALKVSGYAMTALFVAGIAYVVPLLGFFVPLLACLYTLYLLYLGLPVVMKAPVERSFGYTIAVIVISGIVSMIVWVAFIGTMIGSTMTLVGGVSSPSSYRVGKGVSDAMGRQVIGSAAGVAAKVLGATDQEGKEASNIAINAMKTAEAKSQDPAGQDSGKEFLENIVRSVGRMAEAKGDKPSTDAEIKQMTEGLNAIVENYRDADLVAAAQLETLLPTSLDGFPRGILSHEEGPLYPGSDQGPDKLLAEQARAVFRDAEGRSIVLTLTDTSKYSYIINGEWIRLQVQLNDNSDTVSAHSFAYSGHPAFAQYNRQTEEGRLRVWIDRRFYLVGEGSHITEQELRSAVEKVDLDRLEALKRPRT
jgi:Yip1 domain